MLLSLDDAPVSSAAIRSGAVGLVWDVVSTNMESDTEEPPMVPATDCALAVRTFSPSTRLLSGCNATNPAVISAAIRARERTLVGPLYKMMLSPATNAFPEISIPSMATLKTGRSTVVTLSRAEIPVSDASVMFGAPGVPGTLLSTRTVNVLVESAELPRFETRLCRMYSSSLRS